MGIFLFNSEYIAKSGIFSFYLCTIFLQSAFQFDLLKMITIFDDKKSDFHQCTSNFCREDFVDLVKDIEQKLQDSGSIVSKVSISLDSIMSSWYHYQVLGQCKEGSGVRWTLVE